MKTQDLIDELKREMSTGTPSGAISLLSRCIQEQTALLAKCEEVLKSVHQYYDTKAVNKILADIAAWMGK